jgi:hypothetical protein
MKRNPSALATALLACLTLLPMGPACAERPSIAALQAQIATLQSQVTSGTIPGVSGYVTMDLSTPTRPTLRVAGANLQVVNGTGNTNTANGLGNVVVGYDETRTSGASQCSLGGYVDQPTCEAQGGIWALNLKTGSHNVVIGPRHNYSRFAGVVVGLENTISGDWSTVSGGSQNTASGYGSSISGGFTNGASGHEASVSAGSFNTASGDYAGVSGGNGNNTSGTASSISGGTGNTAAGGFGSVSGGHLRSAPLIYYWAAGGLSQSN